MAPQDPQMPSDTGMKEDGVSVKSMRLKVLYTFDDQHKTNHLARWPDVLPIQTVVMEDASTIGVVELQTCIRAVVQNSPELVARIGQDFTIYAFDYSEYETPLVGQGMLSKALAVTPASSDVPGSDPKQLVTGRVCKNIMGLFANGVKETLEVKLRLVSVPTALNNDFIETMNRHRDTSRANSHTTESSEWNAFLANQNATSLSNRPSPIPFYNSSQRDGSSMEILNQLLSPQTQQPTQLNAPNTDSQPEASGNESRGTTASGKGSKTIRAPVKRPRGRKPKAVAAGGNTSGYEEGTDGDYGPPQKKRARVQKANITNSTAFTKGADSLHKAATTSGPLRILRPIAMSPHPQSSAPSNAQEIPRVPTPVPNIPNPRRGTSKGASRRASAPRRESFLARTSTVSEPNEHVSLFSSLEKPEEFLISSIESVGPSPEKALSPADTMGEIGSSPPEFRTRPPSRMRSSPMCPSSPELPQMPRTDSGFMSGSLDDLFGEGDDFTLLEKDGNHVDTNYGHEKRRSPQPINPPEEHLQLDLIVGEAEDSRGMELPANQTSNSRQSKSGSRDVTPRAARLHLEDGETLPLLNETDQLPSQSVSMDVNKTIPGLAPTADTRFQHSMKSHLDQNRRTNSESRQTATPPPPPGATQPEPRVFSRTASMGSLALPAIPVNDPAPPRSHLHRSQTWSEGPPSTIEGPMPHIPMMPGPYPYPGQYEQPEPGFNRVLDMKKVQIKQRLDKAIANGEMPHFCANCGAIQTPTWRKAWAQDFQGQPGFHEYSDKPGCVTALNILTRGEDGKPTAYQMIKKFLGPADNQADYKEFLLCNPCGIWMSKYKNQRPSELWERTGTFAERGPRAEAKKRSRPRPSGPRRSTNTNMPVPTSEANFPYSEANYPTSDTNCPYSSVNLPQTDRVSFSEGLSPTDTTEPIQDPQPRKNSLRNGKRFSAKTSEAASEGLQRAIQSSPARWAGSRQCPVDVEEANLDTTRRLLFPSPRKDGSPKVLGEIATNIVTVATDFRSPKEASNTVLDKENSAPSADAEKPQTSLLELFGEALTRPTTPVGRSPVVNPFKTPTQPASSHRPITRSVTRSIRSAKSPSALLRFNRTPTRTPGSRRSPRHHDVLFDSPYTANIRQMLSEVNNHSSPSRAHNGMALNFDDLPDLSGAGVHTQLDLNFSMEDYLSTDIPMPSSPPPGLNFDLYDGMDIDMSQMGDIDWDKFEVVRAQRDGEREGERGVKTEKEVEEGGEEDVGEQGS